jgi:hypothetical protein
MNILEQMAAKPAEKKSKKDDIPVVEVATDAEVRTAAEKLITAMRDKTAAEATISTQAEILLPKAKELRRKTCLEKKTFYSSIKLQIGKCDTATSKAKDQADLDPLTFSVQNRYSDIPTSDKEKLQEIFGKEFDKCFTPVMMIGMTEEGAKELSASANEKKGMLAKIIAAVGGVENFAKYFTVKAKLEPTEFLHQESTKDATIGAAFDKAVDQELLKPVKPTLKV